MNISHARTVALLAAVTVAGCGSSEKTDETDHQTMPGMTTTSAHAETGDHTTSGDKSTGHDMQGMTRLAAGADGTRRSAGGLTLEPSTTGMPAGKPAVWTLRVIDAHGMPVTRFERDQTKLMHLIVVRDDFTRYQHLHPQLGTGGRFAVSLTLPVPGRYRAISDFTTGGIRYALGVMLRAPGRAVPATLPPPSSTSAADGYSVKLAHAMLMPGTEAKLTFTVLRDGSPVTTLQPYLGTYGHLVALRKPDLAYSHVHPLAHNPKAGTITFAAELATAATYRLFLQFRADGKVHIAPFTIELMQ